MLMQGSTGTMERVTGAGSSGITFGNAAAGAGTSSEGTLLNAGSAGTMERVKIDKGGITFGNAASGAGSGGMTPLAGRDAIVFDVTSTCL